MTLTRACDAVRAAGEAAAADLLEAARGDALQCPSLPRGHWARVRTSNVRERANREIKRRCRSVQSFPSRAGLLRPAGAVMLEEGCAWEHARVFSVESAAGAWDGPEPPAADGALARAVDEAGRAAGSIVAALVDQFGQRG